MSIDFHRLMEPINNNRLIFIDYIDYIDCFPMIDFHRLDRPGERSMTGKPVDFTANKRFFGIFDWCAKLFSTAVRDRLVF